MEDERRIAEKAAEDERRIGDKRRIAEQAAEDERRSLGSLGSLYNS